MKRRETAASLVVPAELAHFELERWAALVAVEEVPGATVASELTTALAAHRAWCDARDRYAAEHGWPTDAVDQLLEQRAARLAVLRRRSVVPGSGRRTGP